MKFSKFVLLIMLSFFILSQTSAQAQNVLGCPYTFTKSLSVGNFSSDVIVLQKILNSDTRTRVAASGPGSAGLETSTFGKATQDAVVRLQQLYNFPVSEINGFVGSRTINLLNQICSKPNTNIGTQNNQEAVKDVNVSLSITNSSIRKSMRVYLSANKNIDRPSVDAIICTGCSVDAGQIRKLSSKEYSFAVTPISDTVKTVTVQIEASKIRATDGSLNSVSSNEVTFVKVDTPVVPVIPVTQTNQNTNNSSFSNFFNSFNATSEVVQTDSNITSTYVNIVTDQDEYDSDNLLTLFWVADQSSFTYSATSTPCKLNGGPYKNFSVSNVGVKVLKTSRLMQYAKDYLNGRAKISFNISCDNGYATASSTKTIILNATANANTGIVDITAR